MSTLVTIQALFVTTGGRMYKAQPRELREGLELDDYKLGLRSDLRLQQYPIDFVNENGHEQILPADKVETIIFNVLGMRPEHSFQEPEYDRLRQQWQSDLQTKTEDGQTLLIDHKLAQEVNQPVKPVAAPGAATATGPLVGNTKVVKVHPPRTPDPKVYDMANEETQEMRKPILDEDEMTMATRAVERIAAGSLSDGAARAVAGARKARSGQNAAPKGKLPTG